MTLPPARFVVNIPLRAGPIFERDTPGALGEAGRSTRRGPPGLTVDARLSGGCARTDVAIEVDVLHGTGTRGPNTVRSMLSGKAADGERRALPLDDQHPLPPKLLQFSKAVVRRAKLKALPMACLRRRG